MTSLHIWDPLCPRSEGREPVGAKLADRFAEDSMEEGFHDTPYIVWQVRSQLSGWCNLAIFIGCGAQLVHEGSSPARVATRRAFEVP